MATAVARKPQEPLPGLGREKELEDAALERQLLERERMKNQLAEYRKQYKEADDAAKGRITELRIKGSVRCGGFVISIKETKGRSVEFETKPSKRIYIRAIKDEGAEEE